jgi:hypothetical protein
LEFDDNYRNLRERSKRLKRENRDLIRNIAIDLEQLQLPSEELENNRHLLLNLFQCLEQNGIKLAKLCPQLFLVCKRLEEQNQRLSAEHARKGVRCLKEKLLIKKLQAKNDKLVADFHENRNTIKRIGVASLAVILADLGNEYLYSVNSQSASSNLRFNNNLIDLTQLRD